MQDTHCVETGEFGTQLVFPRAWSNNSPVLAIGVANGSGDAPRILMSENFMPHNMCNTLWVRVMKRIHWVMCVVDANRKKGETRTGTETVAVK